MGNKPELSNSTLKDSTGKLIFGDNILCSQFLRDYSGVSLFKDIRPEDLEDISGRYVPLYSEERESDTVKRVHLKSEKNPFFIVSLIEHKSYVDYNVAMQVFRYMFYIWEDYGREQEQLEKGITKRKDFKYPPVLPIVYYEGTRNWTASTQLRDRILFSDILGAFSPEFTYKLVQLRDYSNRELLEKKDAISLVMLLNKIQTPEDMKKFCELPEKVLNGILEGTPEHLIETITKVFRVLARRINVTEEKAEEAVSMIKEKKMGYLFENMEAWDVQEVERIRAEGEQLKAEGKQLKAEAAQTIAEAAQIRTETEQLCNRLEKNMQTVIQNAKTNGDSREMAAEQLMKNWGLNQSEAEEKVTKYWNK